MTTHFQLDLERLKKRTLQLGSLVEDSIAKAVAALQRRDRTQARSVIEADDEIDRLDVELEEDCLKVLALHQPSGSDLRLLVSLLKLNKDLERMADQAAGIAHSVTALLPSEKSDLSGELPGMAAKAMAMVRSCLDAVVNSDVDLARQICTADDELDELYKTTSDHLREELQRSPSKARSVLAYLGVCGALERLGDMATSVAEETIYSLEGQLVHHRDDLMPSERS